MTQIKEQLIKAVTPVEREMTADEVKRVDDIYIAQISSQFVIDHIENMLSEKSLKMKAKQQATALVKTLTQMAELPFEGIEVTEEVNEQRYEGSVFAERCFRLILEIDRKLSESDKIKFQDGHDALCAKWGLESN
jgi:galactitol-specific phosphotransferase system IIB component